METLHAILVSFYCIFFYHRPQGSLLQGLWLLISPSQHILRRLMSRVVPVSVPSIRHAVSPSLRFTTRVCRPAYGPRHSGQTSISRIRATFKHAILLSEFHSAFPRLCSPLTLVPYILHFSKLPPFFDRRIVHELFHTVAIYRKLALPRTLCTSPTLLRNFEIHLLCHLAHSRVYHHRPTTSQTLPLQDLACSP
ncbi:hypothetical protein K504DRAFT_66447 [Pleomassaria siparia CBS 279.74]|uniref:Uncharacterized protein n=1 Tax=Pleomassaria siparia CBS 279.74 TaxID=1314801 RepID=A0A6G1K1N5_9PLEO|nr:hypothetical protein K504DRAFT_66447 [Pleomassaria siparia CBS 279.74]